MKIGFFFGAGAEIGYGLPSGGKFAIDLFRQDPTSHKTQLRKILTDHIDPMTPYATNWLPDNYKTRSIYAFGKNEFTSIIESSIEYKRSEIIKRLNKFDEEFDYALKQLSIDRQHLEEKFLEITDVSIGERVYTHTIKLNELLAKDVALFSSEYYSALLDIVKLNNNCDDLKRYVTAFLQLLIGAHGQELVQKLNQELFESAPDDLPIFDDIVGMFRLEFNRVGAMALELLLDEKREFNTDPKTATLEELMSAIAQQIMENLFTTVLDYQKLIDDHFRYLFNPSTEWAKFTKMVIFLNIAREYIHQQAPKEKDLPTAGYYHDLNTLFSDEKASVIGTSNYNNLISGIFKDTEIALPKVIHLNGSIHDYYNPYKNSVITTEDSSKLDQSQIHVPFILTQSGLKPLTSVEMSRRYVELFDLYKGSDAIVIVGFGFQKDDSHINGLFRELLETHNKKLFLVTLNNGQSPDSEVRSLTTKLRISKNAAKNISVVLVDRDHRNTSEGISWVQNIQDQLSSMTENSGDDNEQ